MPQLGMLRGFNPQGKVLLIKPRAWSEVILLSVYLPKVKGPSSTQALSFLTRINSTWVLPSVGAVVILPLL